MIFSKLFFLILLEIKFFILVKSRSHNTFKPQYDPDIAQYLHLLCYESYFVEAGRCIPTSFVLYKSDVVNCDKSNNRCGFYILISKARKTIVLVFSGTISRKQFFKQFFSIFKTLIRYSNSGFVNKYYAESFELLWFHVKSIFLQRKYYRFRVYVTGHSLGSVYASLAAYKISSFNLRNRNNIFLYTFGGPRFATLEFAKNFDKLVPNSWRVVVGTDIVPHFPPCTKMKKRNLKFYKRTFRRRKSKPCDPYDHNGYFHHGVEVWYPLGTNSKYYICNGYPKNEDFGCSDGLVYYKKRLVEYRQNHSIYFRELLEQFALMFIYETNKECYLLEDPKNIRKQLTQ